MGTRHLIAAVIDGQFKVAQYGQWDGYPDGQGATINDILSDPAKLAALPDALRKCRWITDEEIEELNKTNGAWVKTHPWLSRDAGASVLQMVLDHDGLALNDTRGFAGDSLFCEYAYVLDFDKGVLELYEGFNKEQTPEDSRFPSGADWLEDTDGYEPVKLMGSWPLGGEHTVEAMNRALKKYDDEEAA